MKDNQFTIKAIFVEMGSPSDQKFTKIIYKLNTILNLPQYGYCGNDFTSLEELLNYGHDPMVFFEKIPGTGCSAFSGACTIVHP